MLKQTIGLVFVFSLLFNAVAAIEHPSVKITNYDSIVNQLPGTTKEYSVTVQNIGDVPLDSVYLSLFFLPSTWYKFEKGVRLEIGEIKTINYNLTIPSDASGAISYKLTANAIRGFGVVSTHTVPINLVLSTQTTSTVQTTAPVTSTTVTITTQTDEAPEISYDITNLKLVVIVLLISVIISLVLYMTV
jgi:uncharacterized membrane protein